MSADQDVLPTMREFTKRTTTRRLSSWPLFLVVFSTLIGKTHAARDEPFLKVDFFPVGEGDATIIECPDSKGRVALSLVDAGSLSLKGTIAEEYFTYIESKLRRSGFYLKNIILTNPEEKYYNYIEPLVFVRKDSLNDISFYLAGERKSYSMLEEVFKINKNVYEFTRKNEIGNKVSSCGHFAADNETFFDCVKRDSNGPISNSDPIIQLCEDFQITVMAANYGFSLRNSPTIDTDEEVRNKSKNVLTLKITPTGKASPSILMGDFEKDGKSKTRRHSDYFYPFIKDAHDYYTRSEQFPLSLASGLASTVIKIPQNGEATDATVANEFFRDFVQPTFAVVSAGITSPMANPKCEVLQAVNNYLSLFSLKKKVYQCHPMQSKFPVDVKILSNGSDNLFQTSTIVIKNFPHGKVQHNLITIIMKKDEILKPKSRVAYEAKGYDT